MVEKNFFWWKFTNGFPYKNLNTTSLLSSLRSVYFIIRKNAASLAFRDLSQSVIIIAIPDLRIINVFHGTRSDIFQLTVLQRKCVLSSNTENYVPQFG